MGNAGLTKEEVAARLPEIAEWRISDGKLFREFQFQSFAQAFAFMTEGALLSERLNHHPDWRNVFRTVTVLLWSHDIGTLSERDFEWARRIDIIYRRFARGGEK